MASREFYVEIFVDVDTTKLAEYVDEFKPDPENWDNEQWFDAHEKGIVDLRKIKVLQASPEDGE